jgi:Arc/MetJ-type ribon-helix-helix transcriptional regulator
LAKGELIHIRVGKEMKRQMQKLIDIGMFSTEAEVAREGIRNVLIKYLLEAGIDNLAEKKTAKKKNK